MTLAQRTSLLFGVLAVMLGLGAAAWSCTLLVDKDGTSGTDSASSGDPVEGSSTIVHEKEDDSRCEEDSGERDCDYSLGVVNPDEWDNSTGNGGISDTCHYETPQSYDADPSTSDGAQFDTVDDNPTHDVNTAGTETDVDGEGTLSSSDDSGQEMGTGDTYMCFYSSSSDTDEDIHLNKAKDGAATATEPKTFTVN